MRLYFAPVGQWAEALLVSGPLAAPHLMPVEAVSLPVELLPYSVCAGRVWELRSNITAYDAWYVALAETLDARLATLDVKLSRATGTRCEFALPPR